jgi:hypothetical protein
VKIGRRGQRRLDRAFCVLERKSDLVGDDGSRAAYPRHRDRRRSDPHHVAGVVALQVDVADRVAAREPGHLRHEAEPPRLAAELAVGDHLETEALLPADGPDDRGIFHLDAFPPVPLEIQKLRRTQQAADVLGAERRRVHVAIL